MAQIQVRHLRSQILAMSIATMLALYTIGVTIPALAPVSAYATNYDDKNNKHYDDKNNKHYDDTNNYKSAFLSDVEQFFPDSGNYGELFSDDVQQCIYDVMAAYFNNDNNNESSGSTTSGGNNESNSNNNESIPSSQT